MIDVLWYSPGARFSNSDAVIVTPNSLARPVNCNAVGPPGTASARAKRASSSIWQK